MSDSHIMPGDPGERLTLLADAYLHGELSTRGMEELEALLNADPAMALLLIEITQQASMMQEVFGGVLGDDELDAVEGASAAEPAPRLDVHDDVVLDDPADDLSTGNEGFDTRAVASAHDRARPRRSAKRSRRTHLFPVASVILGVAAAVLVVASLFYHFSAKPSQVPSPDVVEQPSGVVSGFATLVRSLDARWADGAMPEGSQPMAEGKYSLRAGLAEIVLSDGAHVYLEAPVVFELRGPNELGLESGRIVAEVPPAAQGFTVATAYVRIVDFGTEFGVDATVDGVTQTHVFEGEVSMVSTQLPTGPGPVRLQSGDGQAIDQAGRAESFDANPVAFVRGEEFRAIFEAEESPYQRWLAYSYKLRRDPAVCLYFGIDQIDRDAGELRNQAVSRGGQLVGRLGDPAHGWSAPLWGEGRWADKPGLRFDHERSTAVVVPTGRDLDLGSSYTLACWVRFDEPGVRHLLTRVEMLESGRNAVINLVAILGEVPAVILQDNSIFYHTGPYVHADWLSLCTDAVLQPDQGWLLIAVTAEAGRVKTFLNGEVIGDRAQVVVDRSVREPLVLGASVAQPGEGMDGWIDEVVVLTRAMTDEELAAMYAAGKPGGAERD